MYTSSAHVFKTIFSNNKGYCNVKKSRRFFAIAVVRIIYVTTDRAP